MTQHQYVTKASPPPDPVRDTRLLAPRHQVIDEDPEPPPFSRGEVSHDAGEVVDAAEVLNDHPDVAQVVATNLLHQLGVVATLDIDPAGQRGLGPTGRTDDRTRGGPGGHRPCSQRSLEHDRASLVPEPRAEGEGPLLPVPVLQDHQTSLPTQHRPAESRCGILQHQPDLKHEVGARRSARALPAGREYVVRVPARRGHAESVGERRPCAGDLRAPARGGLPAPLLPLPLFPPGSALFPPQTTRLVWAISGPLNRAKGG